MPCTQVCPLQITLPTCHHAGYGYGGVLTLELGSLPRAKRLMERLQNVHGFGYMAVSLGYFDTLMSASAASTSSELSSEELASAGIPMYPSPKLPQPGAWRWVAGCRGLWAGLVALASRRRVSS